MKKTIRKTKKESSPADNRTAEKPQRLQRILAAAGVDSRRKCETLILDGAVTVNGKVIDTLPAFADPDKDDIRVHSNRIGYPQKRYFLLNKPKNVICTNVDPQGRKRAIELIDCTERIFCVGRLDAETTGAILLTNDSELTNRLTHPRYKVPKTYEVKLRGRIDSPDIEKLKKGVWLAEGKTARSSIKVIRRTHVETILQVVISQGLNRQVRRIFARIGYKVKSLKRLKIGDLSIKGIPIGSYREITEKQIKRCFGSCIK